MGIFWVQQPGAPELEVLGKNLEAKPERTARVFGGVRGGAGTAAEGAGSRAAERGEAVPSAVSSAPKCKANIAGSDETPGGKGPGLVLTPGTEDPAGKACVCPVVVSWVTVPAACVRHRGLAETLASSVCPSWLRYPKRQHLIGACHEKL